MKNFLLKICSWLLWLWIILLIIAVTTNSTWLGIGLLTVTIAVHVYFAKRAKNKSETNNQDSATSSSGFLTKNFVTPKYFEQVSAVVEDMMTEYKYACRSTRFQQQVEGVNFSQEDNPLIATNEEKTKMLFLIDLVRCYMGLGHNVDISSKSGYGVFYFVLRASGLRPISYADAYSIMSIKNKSMVKNVVDEIAKTVKSNPEPPERFMVSALMGQYDNNRQKKYLVSLYRFVSVAAKADNVVTDEEAKWLSEIMKLQGGNNVRVITTEEEDNPADTQTDTPVTPEKPKRVAAKTELKNLIGLDSVKEEVEALTNYIRIQKTREEKGLKTSPISYHCVFTGNPGTGKTTVARILAKIYKSLGVVSKGQLIETDRSGLVAEYVGQTAVKTNKIIDSALDGVLFIDEAYSLIAGGESDYGKEAIATLLKRMEDDRDRLVVILAGYTKEMKDFIDSNPGLQSRFNRYIEFPDYNADDLYQIFCKQLKQFDYTITEEAEQALKEYLTYQVAHKDQNFGNARFVRNVFERTLQNQANRLAREVNLTTEKLTQIEKTDLPLS